MRKDAIKSLQAPAEGTASEVKQEQALGALGL